MPIPDFSKAPDAIFYSPADNSQIDTVLSVPNDTYLTERGVVEKLYATADLNSDEVIGQRLLLDLAYEPTSGTAFAERLLSFQLKNKADKLDGDLTIVITRDYDFSGDPKISINRIINGSGDFTFSQGWVVRVFANPEQTVYQFSVYLDKN